MRVMKKTKIVVRPSYRVRKRSLRGIESDGSEEMRHMIGPFANIRYCGMRNGLKELSLDVKFKGPLQ